MGLSSTAGLDRTLAWLRRRRGFDPVECIEAKLALIDRYATATGLHGAVVGVSGGVDSAVTLGLLARAADHPGSPLQRVVAATLPIFSDQGATHQPQARTRGRQVAEAFGAEVIDLDLTRGFEALRADAEHASGHAAGPWAIGQLVSYFRTPALYYLATLLTQEGCRAAVFGTTNRDEGSFIGFFGKASDGMVDLQLISDLHKHEVYALAEALGVPEVVRRAPPRGDVFDGRDDAEMIGASYDLVELFGRWRCLTAELRQRLRASWVEADRECFEQLSAKLEQRHRTNAHKYIGDSPAIHLDVYERAVPGGWRRPVLSSPPPHPRDFVAEFSLEHPILPPEDPDPARVHAEALGDFGDSGCLVHGVLRQSECDALVELFARQSHVAAGRDGRVRADPNAPQGSRRASTYAPELAQALFDRLGPALPRVRTMSPHTSTDHGNHPVWRVVGLNPLLRFIGYEPGGLLVPHHDAGFDFGDGRRHTLASVVLMLTSPGQGGALQLLVDPQRHLPAAERRFEDAEHPARPHQVLHALAPPRGSAVVLDHRVPHALAPWHGPGMRLVLRTDIIYERCGAEALRSPDPPPTSPVPGASRLELKARADPYYRHTLEITGSLDHVDHAAFFDDGLPLDAPPDPRASPQWLCTPLHTIASRLATVEDTSQELCVLLSTGVFWPMHQGHVRMMDHARQHLESTGTAVLGGLLAPDHDGYAHLKCGAGTPSAARRIELGQIALADHPWLDIDPWPALHADRALNFTTIIHRLEGYLSAHLRTHRPVRVVYVFGGDNARFAGAFLGRGRCICVPRPGHHDEHRSLLDDARLRRHPHIHLASEPSVEASSRDIRAGDERTLVEPLRGRWRAAGSRPKARIVLREDGPWAIDPWLPTLGPGAEPALERFSVGVRAQLRAAFEQLELHPVELHTQRRLAAERTAGHAVISLDPCIRGEIDLGVSRCFALATRGQPPVLTSRPGYPPLDEQLERIPAGPYVLLDDDRATGQTIRTIVARMPARVEIIRVVHLSTAGNDAVAPDVSADLVDLRDLLAGARDAGLVVQLPHGVRARVPYVLPYVYPSDRLSVPTDAEVAFSRAIWALNVEFFRGTGLRVADTSVGFSALCDYLGFGPETLVSDVASWHHERLSWTNAVG